MLVLSPDSTCDICMECYTDEADVPYAISCGHIFCLSCLARMQPQCPLCRRDFNPRETRKLHVGNVAPQVDAHTQHLWGYIAHAGGGHATLEEMQQVIDRCEVYQNAPSQHTPLGVAHLLLSNLLDTQRTLRVQASQLTELRESRDRVMLDLVAAMQKEEALQALNDVWRYEVESMTRKNRSLREELDRLRSAPQTTRVDSASAVVDRGHATTQHRTVVSNSSLGPTGNRVEAHAYRPDQRLAFLFRAVFASMGVVLFLRTFSAVGGKR